LADASQDNRFYFCDVCVGVRDAFVGKRAYAKVEDASSMLCIPVQLFQQQQSGNSINSGVSRNLFAVSQDGPDFVDRSRHIHFSKGQRGLRSSPTVTHARKRICNLSIQQGT
jgi:hypothetical protein